jgi:hypothetical protein
MPKIEDCLPERGEFELPVPIVNRETTAQAKVCDIDDSNGVAIARWLAPLSVVVVITLANLMSRNCTACSPNQCANPGMTHSGTDQCTATGAYPRSDAGVGATSNANQ